MIIVQNIEELYEKMKTGKDSVQDMAAKAKFILKNTQREVAEVKAEIIEIQ